VLAVSAASALALLVLITSFGSHAQQTPQQPTDGRPRRATPTPTPTPATTAPVQRTGNAPTLGEPPPPPPSWRPTPTPANPEGVEINDNDVIKVDTSLVNLHVRVIDRNNKTIEDVRPDEFHVYEDGVQQTIFNVSKEEVPISYGLAVDTSASLRLQLPTVIDAAKTIINSNQPDDETFLVRFISSDKIETVQDFTSNKDLLIDGIDSFYTEGGQTAIIDAVYLSAERVADYKKGDDSDRRRRALILVTDGEDRASYYKADQLFARLREEDVQIYVIGFVNELSKDDGGIIKKSTRDNAIKLLNRLATETGGKAFFPDSLSDLPEIATQITRDLRTQYVVSYTPTNSAQDGSYRAIRVQIADKGGRDKRIAITRPGRTALRGGPAPTPKTPITRTNAQPTTKRQK
ncbi:MAG: VWA domain-containing protein, partial [Pyrinomonadaceae bacterium]